MERMDIHETALYAYRKLIYLLYLEIGALKPEFHPKMAAKAHLKTAYFQREKERQAVEIYQYIEKETDLEKIVAPFEERTGLSLADVRRAFAEGDWRNKFGSYNFGGPKWARIADVTLELRAALRTDDADKIELAILEVKRLKTNRGYIINEFERTNRRK